MNEEEKEKQAAQQISRDDLISFCIMTNPRYQPAWVHDEIAEKLMAVERGEIKRLILCVPPRHGKSTLATIDFPAWALGRKPVTEIITASYSGELAQDFGTKTRDLVDSQEYKEIFGISLKEDAKSKAKWNTKEGGAYISVGIGGAITGRGANILIIDDPIKNREEAESEVYRKKVWDWFTSTAYTRLEKGGAIILILTRWHTDDLAGRLLEKEKEGGEHWEVVKFPAIAEKKERNRNTGEALWPEKYDLEALLNIKNTIGTYDWYALYQQTPKASETQEFHKHYFKKIYQYEVDRKRTRNYLTIDTAISKQAKADYTGFCDNSVGSENFWHLKAWRAKVSPKELIDILFSLHAKRRYVKIGIEKTIYFDVLKEFLEDEMRVRDCFLPIEPLKHNHTAKESRIRGLLPRYESGSIFHIENECIALEEELLMFPQAINDDVSDATAYQDQIAKKPSSEKPRQPKTQAMFKNVINRHKGRQRAA